MEQHGVTFAHAYDGQRVNRGAAHEHEPGRRVPCEVRRLRYERGRGYDGARRVGVRDAVRDYFVTDGYGAARADGIRPDRDHHARGFGAEVHRERRGRAVGSAVDLEVDGVHTDGANPEHCLSRSGIAIGFVNEVENLRPARFRCHDV